MRHRLARAAVIGGLVAAALWVAGLFTDTEQRLRALGEDKNLLSPLALLSLGSFIISGALLGLLAVALIAGAQAIRRRLR